MTEMKSFKVNNLLKKVVAGVAALTMCVSAMPLSANAEGYSTGTTTSIQQVSNDVYNQVLELGFDEDEAQYIVDHVDEDTILSILGTGNNSNKRSVARYSLQNPTYTDVKGWNTDNSCGSLAATILLVYESNYIYPEISYSSPKGLYNTLKGYIEDKSRWATHLQFTNGLQQYCDDEELGLQSKEVVYDGTNTSIKKMLLICVSYLNDDLPLVALGKYPNKEGHFVVIQGIEILNSDVNNLQANVTVNTGWGGTNAIATIDFVKFIKDFGKKSSALFYLF